MIPRRQPLHSHRNFGLRPLMDEDHPPVLMIWIFAALCGGLVGFMIGLTIGGALH